MKKKINFDALIFDVDGVLLDVEKSFPEVIRRCVLDGWEKFCGGVSDSGGYSDEHNRILKQHGAFNDDYDIAWLLLSISAADGAGKLSEAFPSPEKLAEEINTFKDTVPAWIASRYGNKVSRSRVREMCAKLYGDSEGGGLHMLETPMLRSHWRELPLPVGVYTGRNLLEWELAKESLMWRDFPIERVVHSDMGIYKPSPLGLEILCERLGVKEPLFFGDTASDIMAQKAFGRGAFAAIGGLLPNAELVYNSTEEAIADLCDFKTGR